MKNRTAKRIIALLIAAVILSSLFASAALAEDFLPAGEPGEAPAYCEAVTVSAQPAPVPVSEPIPAPAPEPEADPETGHEEDRIPEADSEQKMEPNAETENSAEPEAKASEESIPEVKPSAETSPETEPVLMLAAAGDIPLTDSMVAVMDPNRKPSDSDLDHVHTWRDTANDVIDIAIDIGSNFIPAGGSIVNYIKYHSPRREESS